MSLTLRLLGTGSSGGVPRSNGDWGACDPTNPKNRRLRCGALITLTEAHKKTNVLIDTPPDIREQLISANVKHIDGVVFTHDHADQTHGIDDVRAFALVQKKQIPTFADTATWSSLSNRFEYVFIGKGGYPPILDRQADLVPLTAVTLHGDAGSIELMPLRQIHGRIESLGFRINDVAYCNDVNELPEETKARLHGLDTLVVDALRETPHPTHAHLDQALAWVEELKPRKTVLTNLHIDMDYDTLRQKLPDNVEPGFDGYTINIGNT